MPTRKHFLYAYMYVILDEFLTIKKGKINTFLEICCNWFYLFLSSYCIYTTFDRVKNFETIAYKQGGKTSTIPEI